MKITFEKRIIMSLDIDAVSIAKMAVDEYIEEYEMLDDGIYDWIGDNIYYFIEKQDIPSEDCDAIIDGNLDDDQLDQLCDEINNYIEHNYKVEEQL